jgi:PAS domain S-box-containing protein
VLLAFAVAADIVFGQTVSDVVFWITLAALLTVPLSFAVGLLRTRLAHAGVSHLLLELGEGRRGSDLRDALARALGDPTLEVAYWIPEINWYVDAEGNPLPPPAEKGGRLAKIVERDGTPIAALIHDESVRSDPELLDAVAAAAALALENERRVAALAESEARHRALLDALPDLIFRMAKDGTYLAYTGNERDLAAPPEQTIGRKLHDVIPKDAADSIMRCIEVVVSSGGVQTVEYQLRIGPLNRHFEARIVQSGPAEVLLIVRDISDRKRAEAQLQRLQEELRARFDEIRRERDFVRSVVQAAPSLFCLVDGQGHIVRFNKALEETFGVTDDDPIRGKPFWEVFIAPDEVEEVRRNFLDRPGENETTWITAAGEPVVVAWRVTELAEERGESRFLISGVDVTERKRQEEELRSSRSRIVEAGDVERRRLERNLHDGAQQRLVSISLFLRLAEGKVETDPVAARDLLARASEELTRALEELRELARGIHPAILTDRGLEPALQALATRAAVPVTLAQAPDERLPEPVEAAAYYVVSEALANVAKYAQASTATVRISRENGRALVEVEDDGVGGADPSLGSGLRGLADRVEALDGRLEVESAPGRGTTVRAEIPAP